MGKQPHRRKMTWEDDPLVPILPEYLRAAVSAKAWSIQALAKRLGEHSQTLDNLVKGTQPKSCRRSRRKKLAAVLGVSEGWLEGTSIAVPQLQGLRRETALRMSPRLQLAAGALIEQAGKAAERDGGEYREQWKQRPIPLSPRQFREYFCPLLFELLRLAQWRRGLTTWREDPDARARGRPEAPGLLIDYPDLRSEEEDRFGLAMIEALNAILSPWFKGKAKLDYDRLRELIGYTRTGKPGEPEFPKYEGRTTDPMRIFPLFALSEDA